jgi:hypothetical protein
MGQTVSLEERHEHLRKGSQTLIKGLQAGFTTERIPDEHCHKINQLVVIKASTRKPHLGLDELHETICFEDLSQNGDFSEPTRRGRSRFWGNLDVD